MDQSQTPLLDTLAKLAGQPHAAFYVPGHKGGRGIAPKLKEILGDRVFAHDLPELPELGNYFPPEGVMEQAQHLAAAAFGAKQTWFLANGSTTGVIAAILATCAPGDQLIVPRNLHQSAISGLILSGAIPIFVSPEYDLANHLTYGVAVETIAATLEQHPDTKAILNVSPTYQGICSDLGAIAALAHQRNIPLIVDEAHGSHFNFHPDLPRAALACGADLVVQSSHKTLGALTQASMLHLQGNRCDSVRIGQAIELIQSSSASNLLFASLDATRCQMALAGKALMSHALELATFARDAIAPLEDIMVFEPQLPQPGCYDCDRTRIVLNFSPLGLSGFDADEILHTQLGVTAELPTLHDLTFVLTYSNTREDVENLVQACTILTREHRRPKVSLSLPLLPELPTLGGCLREIFFGSIESVPLSESIGRIAAETICPYPPGIPLLLPGETIAAEVCHYLQHLRQWGKTISIKSSDPSLETVRVSQDRQKL